MSARDIPLLLVAAAVLAVAVPALRADPETEALIVLPDDLEFGNFVRNTAPADTCQFGVSSSNNGKRIFVVADAATGTASGFTLISDAAYEFPSNDLSQLVGNLFGPDSCTYIVRDTASGDFISAATFTSSLGFGGVRSLMPTERKIFLIDVEGSLLMFGMFTLAGEPIWEHVIDWETPIDSNALDSHPFEPGSVYIAMPSPGGGTRWIANFSSETGECRYALTEGDSTEPPPPGFTNPVFTLELFPPIPGTSMRSVPHQDGHNSSAAILRDELGTALGLILPDNPGTFITPSRHDEWWAPVEAAFGIKGKVFLAGLDELARLNAQTEAKWGVNLGNLPGEPCGTKFLPGGKAIQTYCEFGPGGGQTLVDATIDPVAGEFSSLTVYERVDILTDFINFNHLQGDKTLPTAVVPKGQPGSVIVSRGIDPLVRRGHIRPIAPDGSLVPAGENPDWKTRHPEAFFKPTSQGFGPVFPSTSETVTYSSSNPLWWRSRVSTHLGPPDEASFALEPLRPRAQFSQPAGPNPVDSVRLQQSSNTVSVILERSDPARFYDFRARDGLFGDWQILLENVPGTGGEISLDQPLDRPRRFFSVEEHQ